MTKCLYRNNPCTQQIRILFPSLQDSLTYISVVILISGFLGSVVKAVAHKQGPGESHAKPVAQHLECWWWNWENVSWDGKIAFLRGHLQVQQASSEMCLSLSWPFFLGAPTPVLSCPLNRSISTPVYVDLLWQHPRRHIMLQLLPFFPSPPLCLVLVTLPAVGPSAVTCQHSLDCQITVPPPLFFCACPPNPLQTPHCVSSHSFWIKPTVFVVVPGEKS